MEKMAEDEWVAVVYRRKSDFEGSSVDAPELHRMHSPFYSGEKWAVRRGGAVLNKEGEWEFEPMPSRRDGAFYGRCRFDSMNEAVERLGETCLG